MRKDTVVVIPAAGQGKRMDAGTNKLLLTLGKTTILEQTLRVFLGHSRIKHIYLVTAQSDREQIKLIIGQNRNVTLVEGGPERQDSVFNALELIRQQPELPHLVLVHDGARPMCSAELIDQIIEQSEKTGAAIPVIPLTDTIRQITKEKSKVIDRSQLFATQTPQGFRTQLLLDAASFVKKKNEQVTDDAALVEHYGYPVSTVSGESTNLKITTQTDLEQARWLLQQKEQNQENTRASISKNS